MTTEVTETEFDQYDQDSTTIGFKADLGAVAKTEGSHGGEWEYKTSYRPTSEVIIQKSLDLDEVISSKEFDWRVDKGPIYDRYEGETRLVKSHQSLIRSDSKGRLGRVKSSAIPLQNRDLFEFCRPLIDSGDFDLAEAHCIDGGRTILALMRNKHASDIEIVEGDEVSAYVQAVMSRGSRPKIRLSNVLMRKVCDNGLVSFGEESFNIDMTSGARKLLREASQVIADSAEVIANQTQMMKQMASTPMSEEQYEELVRRSNSFAWNDPAIIDHFETDEDRERHAKEMEKNMKTVQRYKEAYLVERERMSPEYQDTFWCGYQGITYRNSHTRSRSHKAAVKAKYLGVGAKISNECFKVASKMIKADSPQVN